VIARSLSKLLRNRLTQPQMRMLAAEVVAIPDARHVTVEIEGVQVTVAHMQSYVPVLGDCAYLIAQGSTVVAVDAIR
jgi:hypothetical protein